MRLLLNVQYVFVRYALIRAVNTSMLSPWHPALATSSFVNSSPCHRMCRS